jgi:hypothetical protein
VWPIYQLQLEAPQSSGNILFYETAYTKGEEDVVYDRRYLDDKNEPGKTLGQRRLQLANKGYKLRQLSKAIFTIQDLLKVHKSRYWYIDTAGNLFQYDKQEYYTLTCHKIKDVIPIATGGSLVEVVGCNQRFKTLHNITTEKYCGILHKGMLQIFYGACEEQFNKTRRMI